MGNPVPSGKVVDAIRQREAKFAWERQRPGRTTPKKTKKKR